MYFQIIDSGFIRTLALALHFSYSSLHIIHSFKTTHQINTLYTTSRYHRMWSTASSMLQLHTYYLHVLSYALNDYMYRPTCTSYMSWLPHHMIAIHYLHPHIFWIAYMNLDTILSAAILSDELIVKKVLSPRWQEAEEIYPSTQMMAERTFARCWYLKTTLVLFLLDLLDLLVGT